MRPTSPSQILRPLNLSAFLISDLTNIRYITGLELSAGLLLVRPRSYQLFVDGRYGEAAKKQVREGVHVRDSDRFASALHSVAQCGFESEEVTVNKLRRWKRKYKNTKFVPQKGVIQEYRRAKDAEERTYFRRSQRITREMLRRIPSVLRSAPTERELAWKLTSWAHEIKASGLSFDPIVAFGSHTSCPHHHPTNRRLKRGQIVQIDVGVRYRGYCSDQSAVYFTGTTTPLQRKVLRAVEEAKEAASNAVRPGITNHELDRIARSILREHGFEEYFPHSLGHGVGLDIHEGISLSAQAPRKKLLPNEIITIEPGVYLPGKFGIRLEEEVIVC